MMVPVVPPLKRYRPLAKLPLNPCEFHMVGGTFVFAAGSRWVVRERFGIRPRMYALNLPDSARGAEPP
jgi:hypothetical protein